jgi:hypothetical protein
MSHRLHVVVSFWYSAAPPARISTVGSLRLLPFWETSTLMEKEKKKKLLPVFEGFQTYFIVGSPIILFRDKW